MPATVCGSPLMATAAFGKARVCMNADPHTVAGMARSYKLGATGFRSAIKARAAFDSVRSRW